MNTKRWIVTYTKHIKQKKKVYQDGILELSGSGDKVALYDDCEKLVNTRFLKKDEVIECGGMLTFETHLVDIGDPEGRPIPLNDFTAGRKDVTLYESAKYLQHKVLSESENKKNTLQIVPPKDHSNAIHGSTGVRKQSEHCSSGALQGHEDAIKATLKEWTALYTTQITQKAKRYHDGILRLVSCGSHMNQAILLNEDGTVLSSKYLKSVECLETGKKYEFPNYLVEICEIRILSGEDVHKRSLEQVACSRSSSIGKFVSTWKGSSSKQLPYDLQKGHSKHVISSSNSDGGSFDTVSSKPMHDEWNALYTSQITQKAKRYHDGILRLTDNGSIMKKVKVTLLTVDGLVLSSRYLKPVECVEAGHTLEVPNYLVEICEPRIDKGGDIQGGSSEQVASCRSPTISNFINIQEVCINKPLPKDLKKGCSKQVTVGSNSDNDGGFSDPQNKRTRDACQILFALKRPFAEEDSALRKLQVKHVQTSQSSDLVLLDGERRNKTRQLNMPMTKRSRRTIEDNHKGKTTAVDSEHDGGLSSNKCYAASDLLSREATGRMCRSTPAEKTLHCSSNRKYQHEDISGSSLRKNTAADENTNEIMILRQGWMTLAHKVSATENLKCQISHVPNNTQADEICETTFSMGASSPTPMATDEGSKHSESESFASKCLNVDEFPTFDLGF